MPPETPEPRMCGLRCRNGRSRNAANPAAFAALILWLEVSWSEKLLCQERQRDALLSPGFPYVAQPDLLQSDLFAGHYRAEEREWTGFRDLDFHLLADEPRIAVE